MRRLSVSRLVAALFALRAVLVVGVVALLVWSIADLHQDFGVTRRATAAFEASQAIESEVRVASAQMRGAPARRTFGALPAQIAGLRAAVPGNASPSALDGAARALGGFTTGSVPDARTIGGVLAGLRGYDLELWRVRAHTRAEIDRRASMALVAGIIGAVLLTLLLGAQIAYLLRSVIVPMQRVAAAAGRLRAGELGVRVAQDGRGEVRRLAASFNEMADAIQAQTDELSQAKHQLEDAVASAEQASVTKSNFLANMSHEIRTPLNGVIGMLGLLSETGLTAEQREYVGVGHASGEALMAVVNDVLDIAKIESGRLELEVRDFDLHEMVERTCDMVAASAQVKGLELQSYVHDDVPRAVCGDRTRVAQILVNLLSNAIKFTSAGEVGLEVSVEGDGDAQLVVFEVRDTGIGIEPDRIPELFKPFVQAEPGTTRRFGGTGLGLTITAELTRLMGGDVGARSVVSRGSVFRVRLPFAVAKDPLRPPAAPEQLRGLRVLVVDDNSTNRRVFEAYLEAWGMRSEAAIDASDGIARLQAAVDGGEPFALVLLDYNLPSDTGLELARQVRSRPGLQETRIILITSSVQAGADDPALGISAQLTKPVRRSRLLDAITSTMAGHAARGPTPAGPWLGFGAGGATGAGEAPARPRGRGCRIAVAEDQPVNWLLIERLLDKRGHHAFNATDGERLLTVLGREQIDLVLMDCQMPVLDGYDATREIRRREAATGRRRMPIVAMTAHAMDGERERCLAAGMDDYLAKPITAASLDEALARWLPQAPEGDGRARLQPERLEELRDLFGVEELERLLSDLVDELDASVHQIVVSAAESDLPRMAAAAHSIQGSARLVGAEELAQAAEALERQVRSPQAATAIGDSVAVVVERLERALEAIATISAVPG